MTGEREREREREREKYAKIRRVIKYFTIVLFAKIWIIYFYEIGTRDLTYMLSGVTFVIIFFNKKIHVIVK